MKDYDNVVNKKKMSVWVKKILIGEKESNADEGQKIIQLDEIMLIEGRENYLRGKKLFQ